MFIDGVPHLVTVKTKEVRVGDLMLRDPGHLVEVVGVVEQGEWRSVIHTGDGWSVSAGSGCEWMVHKREECVI